MFKYSILGCFQHGAHCLCCYTLTGATGILKESIIVKQNKVNLLHPIVTLFQFCNLHVSHF